MGIVAPWTHIGIDTALRVHGFPRNSEQNWNCQNRFEDRTMSEYCSAGIFHVGLSTK